MQANKEMNRMLSTKKATMIFKYIVSQISVAALVVIVAMAGSAAANDNPRPIVTSTSPANGALDVPVNTTVTVNFSMPMKCNSINPNTFKLDAFKLIRIAAGRVTCNGNSATFTPLGALAINTLYKLKFVGSVKGFNDRTVKTDFESFFTTGENFNTPTPTATATSTATSTATATPTPTSTATPTATPSATPTPFAPAVISTYPGIVGCSGQGAPSGQNFTVTFSEPMNASTLQGAFFVSTPGDGPFSIPIPGTVTYDATNDTATFTPTGGVFPVDAAINIAITGAESASGLFMAQEFDWSFTTGATTATTPPLVSSTNPANAATGIGTNQAIMATFDKGIHSSTLTETTFTLFETVGVNQVSVPGTVTYSTIGTSAIFTPSSVLDPDAVFTATITTGVKDLSGNPLASNFVWTFTTGATTDTTAPTVTSTNPAASASNIGVDASINATFSEAMNPSTLNPVTFTVTGPGSTVVPGKVSYDVPDQIVTFTPTSTLASSTNFSATITGAQDLAANLLPTYSWPFQTGATTTGQASVNLGAASAYAILAATTVSAPGPIVVNGNLGLTPGTSVTGFPPAIVDGTIDIDDTAAAAAQASLLTAYDYIFDLPPGTTITGNIGGSTLSPGIYTAPSTSLAVSSGNLILDAQGDTNAVWIFQIGTTLDVTPGLQVMLANGAQASNIFWQVGSSATIDTTAVMQGNILALTSITVNGGAILNGRALALNGAVTAGGSSASLPSCQ
jgi:Ice-binding-like/Bacterial Ig-like domain